MKNQILEGDALTVLKTLPSESIDCIITSPPYYNLRDYKVDGQLGHESTVQEYIEKLVSIFDECKRVLKSSGTCWVVMGDSYNGNKSLSLVPDRFAIEMTNREWILRNTIIWFKSNCMPSSAKDRFTVDFENVYFFTKSQKYYFKTQYEKSISYGTRWGGDVFKPKKETSKYLQVDDDGKIYSLRTKNREQVNMYPNGHSRIKRCVWKINTKPFPEAHFAVFPPELVKQCLDAGCPSEICRKCGKSPIPVYDETRINTRIGKNVGNGKSGKDLDPNKELHNSDLSKYRQQIIRTQNGIEKCNCNAGFDSGIVLDPFMGSGTVALVALKNAMNFVGIELNPDYITMAQKRIEPYLKQEKITQFTVK